VFGYFDATYPVAAEQKTLFNDTGANSFGTQSTLGCAKIRAFREAPAGNVAKWARPV